MRRLEIDGWPRLHSGLLDSHTNNISSVCISSQDESCSCKSPCSTKRQELRR